MKTLFVPQKLLVCQAAHNNMYFYSGYVVDTEIRLADVFCIALLF